MWDGDILNSAQPALRGEKRLFLTPSRPRGRSPPDRKRACLPLAVLCLVSVATGSERMQHPDARSGGIPLLTQGRGKWYIADGAQARCRICRESDDGPRVGRPQSSSLLGELFGSLCQKCAKCCFCSKKFFVHFSFSSGLQRSSCA